MQTKIKKIVYLALTIMLVFLLGLILYSMIEVAYVREALSAGGPTANVCYFGFLWQESPVWLRLSWIFIGFANGYFLGMYWWRVVYIEKRHWRFRKKKATKKRGSVSKKRKRKAVKKAK